MFGASSFMAPSLGAILGGTTHFLTTSEAVLALLSSSIQLAAFLQKALVILREGNGTPLQYSWPGKSHGWRSLVGCSPRDSEKSDTTERLHFHFSLSRIGEGNGNPLQCSCLENPRDWGAWWAAVYGVAQSRTRLKRLSSSSMFVFKNYSQEQKRKRQERAALAYKQAVSIKTSKQNLDTSYL